MLKSRCLLALSVVPLFALTGADPAANMTAAFAGSGAPVPFHGAIHGSVTATEPFSPGSDPACNANFTGDPSAPGASISLFDESVGNFTYLGHSRLEAVSCIDPLSPFSMGHGIIHAANGDELWIAFANTGIPSPADPSLILVDGLQWLAGGTGRFAGASGVQACSFTIQLETAATGTIHGACDGTLIYDASVRRARL